jgi:hypothetical protein
MLGYDPDPDRRLSSKEALEGFLRAVGVPSERLPPGDQDRSRLLRSVLAAPAQQGRRVLMIIDNVSTSEQARPMLPTDGACAAIVTSRHTLADLEARLIDLGALSIRQSVDLLAAALRVRDPSDSRIHDHPGDACRLAELCAGLPLALQVVAAQLASAPAKPLAVLTGDLADTEGRLDELAYADRAVRAAVDLSHRQLPQDKRGYSGSCQSIPAPISPRRPLQP